MIRIFFLIVALACAPLLANNIAVAAPDGRSGWLLLEDPPGAAGPGLSEFAGDPGLPAPDALGWPHVKDKDEDGRYPVTDLWKFTDGTPGTWQRATNYCAGQTGSAWRRTLYAVFLLNGEPFVLHYDPRRSLGGGYSQVMRVVESPDTAALERATVLNSAPTELFNAPAVSPDGRHLALRVATLVERRWQYSVRVYGTADWKAVADYKSGPASRSVWLDDSTLAFIAWDAETQPQAPQARSTQSWQVRLYDSHAPLPGVLKLAKLADGALEVTDLLKGEFPPDHYTRTLHADGGRLLLARKDGEQVTVELREPRADGEITEIARFESFRGCAVTPGAIMAAGVRVIDRSRVFVKVDLPRVEDAKPLERAFRQISSDGHGGLIDLGHGVVGILEPVTNPEYDHKNGQGQLLRHTLVVMNWHGCDSMRNPRMLQQLSKLVSRFNEIGTIRSTLLVFDVNIPANEGKNQKNGRYVELYGSGGREGKGRIRTEDNLGGQWIVQSIDGDKNGDDYYDCVGVEGSMRKRAAADVGKAYDDLITQLEARRLLMLTGAEADPHNGGLMFLQRGYVRDPNQGATWRTWVFLKHGRVIDTERQAALREEIAKLRKERAGQGADTDAIDKQIAARTREERNLPRERLILQFVADLPNGSAGRWEFPHALAQVQMRFALSNQQNAAVTDLYFEPRQWVALPNLKQDGGKELLLPGVFRIYDRDAEGGFNERLKAVAVTDARALTHPQQLARGGKLQPGYEVPMAAFSSLPFTRKQR